MTNREINIRVYARNIAKITAKILKHLIKICISAKTTLSFQQSVSLFTNNMIIVITWFTITAPN